MGWQVIEPASEVHMVLVEQLCSLHSRVASEAGESLREGETQRSLLICLQDWSDMEGLFF